MLQKIRSWNNLDLGLLLIRVALAVVLIAHGWQKLQNMSGTTGFFGFLGLPPELAYVVMIIELVGGFLILLGLFTKEAALAFAAVMVGAIITVKGSNGLMGSEGKSGYELELMLLLISLAMSAIGPGRYTVYKLFGSSDLRNQ